MAAEKKRRRPNSHAAKSEVKANFHGKMMALHEANLVGTREEVNLPSPPP